MKHVKIDRFKRLAQETPAFYFSILIVAVFSSINQAASLPSTNSPSFSLLATKSEPKLNLVFSVSNTNFLSTCLKSTFNTNNLNSFSNPAGASVSLI